MTWRDECGATADAPPPFDNFKPKDLRRGAATLMRQLGISPELAARLGHKDAGHLLVTVYAETRRKNLRAELQAIAGGRDRRASRLEAALVRPRRDAWQSSDAYHTSRRFRLILEA